jgi:hypothetical protein
MLQRMGQMKRQEARFEEVHSKRRVYMGFFHRAGWQVSFLEADLKTSVGRALVFVDSEKIVSIWRRCGESRMSEDRNSIESAIQKGRGGVWLRLTPEQYGKLK